VASGKFQPCGMEAAGELTAVRPSLKNVKKLFRHAAMVEFSQFFSKHIFSMCRTFSVLV